MQQAVATRAAMQLKTRFNEVQLGTVTCTLRSELCSAAAEDSLASGATMGGKGGDRRQKKKRLAAKAQQALEPASKKGKASSGDVPWWVHGAVAPPCLHVCAKARCVAAA